MEAVTKFFEKVGLPIQEEKTEVMSPLEEWAEVMPEEMFRVLGLNFQVYTRDNTGKMFLEVTVPNGRLNAILDMIETMQQHIRDGMLSVKTAQKTAGAVISAVFHNRHKAHISKLRMLFIAADERRFKDVIRKRGAADGNRAVKTKPKASKKQQQNKK